MEADHRGGGHSAEELKLIVSSSRFAGHLPEIQEDMIHRVLDLEDLSVREIMKPRRDIVSVPSKATLDEVLDTMVDEPAFAPAGLGREARSTWSASSFSKTCCGIWHERRASMRRAGPPASFQLRRIMRKPLIVPGNQTAAADARGIPRSALAYGAGGG